MKYNHIRSILSLVTAATMLPVILVNSSAADNAAGLTDSGLSYDEIVGTVENPGAGYTTTVWAHCAPGDTPVYDPHGSLVLFFINIGKFSIGVNGEKDYALDETFFKNWRTTFENCRKNGCMIAMRFRYDEDGVADCEPETFDLLLDHIKQIKENGILDDYKNIITHIESGFIGKWGEQHGSKFAVVSNKAKLVDALVNAVPENIGITVRTPDTFAEWAGIKRSQLLDEEIHAAAEASSDPEKRRILSKRIGMYDDGYMGSDSDLGTYSDRKLETDWLGSVSTDTYFGGEFSYEPEKAYTYDTYLPQNSIPEMYKTHLSYINGNIFPKYKEYEFKEEYSVPGVNNSAYYGENCFQFIRDHIGYRFVLRKSELTPQTEQGGELRLHFNVENTGFANPVPHTQNYIILEKDGVYMKAPISSDCHDWKSCTVTENDITMHVPEFITPGKWNVYFKSVMGECADEFKDMPLRSIRFANDGVWNEDLGADKLGTVEIKESQVYCADNTFREAGSQNGSDELLTVNSNTNIDAEVSYGGEWTDDMLIKKEDNGSSVSVKSDESALYILGKLTDGTEAPIYNIEFTDPAKDNEKFKWYFAYDGYIYTNHEGKTGLQCKWNNGTFEMRIPYDKFSARPGDKIGNLRLYIQDSGNSWKTVSEIKVPELTLPTGISAYSYNKKMYASEFRPLTLIARTSVEDASYQWLRNGEPIEGATGQSYEIPVPAPSDKGGYTVKISGANNSAGTVKIAEIIDVITNSRPTSELVSTLRGDANLDAQVNIADAVLVMQVATNPDKYAQGRSEVSIKPQGEINADIDGKTGLSNSDALLIQKFKLGLINSFE